MFYTRLNQACKDAGTTVTSVLKAIHIGTANGTYWKNGSVPSSDVVVKLAEFLNVSTDYLLTGKKERVDLSTEQKEILNVFDTLSTKDKIKVVERAETLAELASEREAVESTAAKGKKTEQPETHIEQEEACNEEDYIFLDLYDMPVSAGTGVYIDYTTSEVVKLKRSYETERAKYMVRVSGDSMEPRYQNGDIVLVETTQELREGEVGIFMLNSESYIKQLGNGCLISLNPKYKPIYFSEDDRVVYRGKVIGILSAEDRRDM